MSPEDKCLHKKMNIFDHSKKLLQAKPLYAHLKKNKQDF